MQLDKHMHQLEGEKGYSENHKYTLLGADNMHEEMPNRHQNQITTTTYPVQSHRWSQVRLFPINPQLKEKHFKAVRKKK